MIKDKIQQIAQAAGVGPDDRRLYVLDARNDNILGPYHPIDADKVVNDLNRSSARDIAQAIGMPLSSVTGPFYLIDHEGNQPRAVRLVRRIRIEMTVGTAVTVLPADRFVVDKRNGNTQGPYTHDESAFHLMHQLNDYVKRNAPREPPNPFFVVDGEGHELTSCRSCARGVRTEDLWGKDDCEHCFEDGKLH